MRPISSIFKILIIGTLIAILLCDTPIVASESAPPLNKLYLPLVAPMELAGRPYVKRGLTLACGEPESAAQVQDVAGARAVWIWDWGTQPPLFPGIESIATIKTAADIGKSLGGNSPWLLGFNEPDASNQANLTPDEGARLWALLEQAYPFHKLASPQPMYTGFGWLEAFRAAYIVQQGHAPRLDALAIHTYSGNTAAAFIAQVRHAMNLARAWGIAEVWVTEFSLAPLLDRSIRDTSNELQVYLDFLDSEPLVTRYAIWTNRVECMRSIHGFAYEGQFDTPLFHMDGSMSELGRVYSNR
jgi:hypothetical protein